MIDVSMTMKLVHRMDLIERRQKAPCRAVIARNTQAWSVEDGALVVPHDVVRQVLQEGGIMGPWDRDPAKTQMQIMNVPVMIE